VIGKNFGNLTRLPSVKIKMFCICDLKNIMKEKPPWLLRFESERDKRLICPFNKKIHSMLVILGTIF
jgi:hypothetical protein